MTYIQVTQTPSAPEYLLNKDIKIESMPDENGNTEYCSLGAGSTIKKVGTEVYSITFNTKNFHNPCKNDFRFLLQPDALNEFFTEIPVQNTVKYHLTKPTK